EVVEKVQVRGERSREAQDNMGNFKPGASADNTISAAVIVGIENNKAQAIVDSGAHLDAMRALRLISSVTYPYLTRPDEFIPLSGSELSTQLQTAAYDSANDSLPA